MHSHRVKSCAFYQLNSMRPTIIFFTECSRSELHEMGRRLLDWFKLLQDDYYAREGKSHPKVKRNSKKKELHDDGKDVGCLAALEMQQLSMS